MAVLTKGGIYFVGLRRVKIECTILYQDFVYNVYHVFHWLTKNKYKFKLNFFKFIKTRHCTDFEADLWPETGNVFFVLFCFALTSHNNCENTKI